MRVLLDENLPAELVLELRALGHDAEDVGSKGLSGRPDDDVWAAAQAEGRLLITQDIRFGDTRMFTRGEHSGFVLMRLKRPGRRAVIAKVREIFVTEDVESWPACFVVVSDSKVRVRRSA